MTRFRRKLLKPEEYASPLAAKAVRTALRKRPNLSDRLFIVPEGSTFFLSSHRKARIEILTGNPEIILDGEKVQLKLHIGDAIAWNEPDPNKSFICVADILGHQHQGGEQ